MSKYLIHGYDRIDGSDSEYFYVEANSIEEAYKMAERMGNSWVWDPWEDVEQMMVDMSPNEDGSHYVAAFDENDILMFKLPD